MSGERDLQKLLTGMGPQLRPDRFVFTVVAQQPQGVRPFATVAEDEGLTMVLTQDEADQHGLEYDYVAAMITLRVHSALDAVGLTAAVATRLASAGISCNVVAGWHHDHLFVPFDAGHQAVTLLRELPRN